LLRPKAVKIGKKSSAILFSLFLVLARRSAKRFSGAKLKPLILPNFGILIGVADDVSGAFVWLAARNPGLSTSLWLRAHARARKLAWCPPPVPEAPRAHDIADLF
jgi:hypothetical protein